MSRIFLDITDSQITLIAGSSIIQSPGAALAGGSSGGASLVFGEAVFETLKRRPLETRTDFWAQLSTVPLNTEFAGARHSADLVYEHLKFVIAEAERDVGSVSDIVIIAPSSTSQAQLELLIGILDAVGKSPSAILDRALVHQYVIGKAGVHLDLQWRQMVFTEMTLEDGQLVVGKSSTLPGIGYLDLLEQCLEHFADMCVEQTRFDPRRSAEAEQLLFNAIPGTLATLTISVEASLSVSGYDFKVSRTGLEFVGKRLMAAVEGVSGAISVDGLLVGLPGVRFNSTAAHTTLAEAAEQILSSRPPDAELSRISRAKVQQPSAVKTAASEVDVTEVSKAPQPASQAKESDPVLATDFAGPTHVLVDSHAYLIANQSEEAPGFGLVVEGDTVRVAEDFRSEVNVLSTESSHDRLHVGCRLYRSDGTEALLIRVEG
jgi:hypothetical protein